MQSLVFFFVSKWMKSLAMTTFYKRLYLSADGHAVQEFANFITW
jgi:hypothetical protein